MKPYKTIRQRWEGGKGSRRRPMDEEKFKSNMDKVFPDKKPWYEDRDLSWLEQENDGTAK